MQTQRRHGHISNAQLHATKVELENTHQEYTFPGLQRTSFKPFPQLYIRDVINWATIRSPTLKHLRRQTLSVVRKPGLGSAVRVLSSVAVRRVPLRQRGSLARKLYCRGRWKGYLSILFVLGWADCHDFFLTYYSIIFLSYNQIPVEALDICNPASPTNKVLRWTSGDPNQPHNPRTPQADVSEQYVSLLAPLIILQVGLAPFDPIATFSDTQCQLSAMARATAGHPR